MFLFFDYTPHKSPVEVDLLVNLTSAIGSAARAIIHIPFSLSGAPVLVDLVRPIQKRNLSYAQGS